MNVARLSYFVSASALALAAVPATAQIVIDFGGLDTTGPFGGNGKAFTSYTEDGFTVSAPVGQYVQSTNDGNGDQLSLLTGQFNTQLTALLTIASSTPGQFFNFAGFAVREAGPGAGSMVVNAYNGSTLAYTFNVAVVPNTTFDTVGNLFSSNITVDRVTFATTSIGQLFIDNLNVTAVSVSGAVPEPATWAMMIAGFGLVGGAMRRRSMKVAYA